MALAQTDRSGPYQVADLGCGWGGLMVALARQYPYARITGYEISWPPYIVSKLRSVFYARRMVVTRDNFMGRDLSSYDIVFCYLSNHHMRDLKPKLAALKPGSVIVSCSFPIPGWAETARETVKGIVPIPVFLYRVG